MAHVTDAHRTDRLAVAAGGAGPDDVLVDDSAGKNGPLDRRRSSRGLFGPAGPLELAYLLEPAGDRVHMVALLGYQFARLQRLAGRRGRAVDRAAAAFGAGVHVQQTPPAVILDLAHAEGLLALELHAVLGAGSIDPHQEDVGQGCQDVEVLAEGQVVQEGQHERHVGPEHHLPPAGDRRRIDIGEDPGQRGGDERPSGLVMAGLQREESRVADQIRHHQQTDPDQDQHRFQAEMETDGPHDQPPPQSDQDSRQDQQGEDILQSRVELPQPAAEQREVEFEIEAAADQGDRPQRDHDEAGEDSGVHQTSALLVEQAALAETYRQQTAQPLAETVDTFLRFGDAQQHDASGDGVGEQGKTQQQQQAHEQRAHRSSLSGIVPAPGRPAAATFTSMRMYLNRCAPGNPFLTFLRRRSLLDNNARGRYIFPIFDSRREQPSNPGSSTGPDFLCSAPGTRTRSGMTS